MKIERLRMISEFMHLLINESYTRKRTKDHNLLVEIIKFQTYDLLIIFNVLHHTKPLPSIRFEITIHAYDTSVKSNNFVYYFQFHL